MVVHEEACLGLGLGLGVVHEVACLGSGLWLGVVHVEACLFHSAFVLVGTPKRIQQQSGFGLGVRLLLS